MAGLQPGVMITTPGQHLAPGGLDQNVVGCWEVMLGGTGGTAGPGGPVQLLAAAHLSHVSGLESVPAFSDSYPSRVLPCLSPQETK